MAEKGRYLIVDYIIDNVSSKWQNIDDSRDDIRKFAISLAASNPGAHDRFLKYVERDSFVNDVSTNTSNSIKGHSEGANKEWLQSIISEINNANSEDQVNSIKFNEIDSNDWAVTNKAIAAINNRLGEVTKVTEAIPVTEVEVSREAGSRIFRELLDDISSATEDNLDLVEASVEANLGREGVTISGSEEAELFREIERKRGEL